MLNERVQLGWEVVGSPVKSDASDAAVAIDPDTAGVLRAWRRTQLAERLALGSVCHDTGLVFTLEDGNAYHPDRLTDTFEWEAFQAGLPPIRAEHRWIVCLIYKARSESWSRGAPPGI